MTPRAARAGGTRLAQRAAMCGLLVVHGLIHILGFVSYTGLGEVEGISYETSLIHGVFAAGAPVFGLLWLAAGAGLVVSGASVLLLRPWWVPLTLAATLLSLALTILGLPDSPFGVAVNGIVLAYLVVGGRMGWLPRRATGAQGEV